MSDIRPGRPDRADRADRRAPRRRAVARERRLDLLVGLGILLPGVVATSIAIIGAEGADPLAGLPPRSAALTSSTLVCPSALAADGVPVRVLRAPGAAGGDVAVRVAPLAAAPAGEVALGAPTPLPVPAGALATAPAGSGAVVIDGQGAAAPGVLAGRGDALAVPECAGPVFDDWFVGVGASAGYATVLEIVNPDEGDAVVDVELHGADGVVEEPSLRGIQVPGGTVRRVDLAAVAPRAEVTAARVSVVRGRAAVAARTTRDPLGRARVSTDFLPADVAGTDRLLLGVPAGPASATLLVVNPGDDEVRVTPRLVTADAVFTPTQVQPVAVAPRAMATIDLTPVLQGEAAAGVVGVRLETTGDVAASMRVVTPQGDLALLAPVAPLRDASGLALPPGAKSLVLGGARRTGTVTVRPIGADGAVLEERPVEIGPDRTAVVPLPEAALGVTITARTGRISGVVVVPTPGRRGGLAVVRLGAPALRASVPAVLPR